MQLSITCSFEDGPDAELIGTITFQLTDRSYAGTCESLFAVSGDRQVISIWYFIAGTQILDRRSLEDVNAASVLMHSGADIDLVDLLFQISLGFYENPNKPIDISEEFHLSMATMPSELEETLVRWERSQFPQTPTALQ